MFLTPLLAGLVLHTARFARCAEIDRAGDGPSVYRGPAVAALDRELGAGTAARLSRRRRSLSVLVVEMEVELLKEALDLARAKGMLR